MLSFYRHGARETNEHICLNIYNDKNTVCFPFCRFATNSQFFGFLCFGWILIKKVDTTMFRYMSLNVLWGHSVDLLYINCSVMNPQVNCHTGLSDVSQRRTVSETLVQSTSKAGETKVCALGVIKEYQGDLSPGMPLVHKNERKACHYFISLVNLHWKQIYRLASISPASTEAEIPNIQ